MLENRERAAPPRTQVVRWGRWYPKDSQGFLISDTAPTLIREPFRSAVDEAIETIPRRVEGLLSLVLRGSVPRGLGRTDRSDLDFVVFLDEGANDPPNTVQLASDLGERHGLRGRVDIEWVRWSEVCRSRSLRYFKYIVSFQSLLLAGADLSVEVPRYRVSPELATLLPQLEARRQHAQTLLGDSGFLPGVCAWLSRSVIRAAFELTLSADGRYSRDLSLCAEAFSSAYPSMSGHMETVMHAAINPSPARDSVERLLQLCAFVVEERGRLCTASEADLRQFRRRHGSGSRT